ncbi:MAG: methionyl-tRNA formyltransferase, partial [Candidatus Omnitrophota bacterium]
MKIIYFGSSNFSLIILENLIRAGFVPRLIVSQPDKPKGRGLSSCPTEVSEFAKKTNIPLIKPSSLKNPKIIDEMKDFEADLFIIADYGKILPDVLLSIPKFASLGAHPSMLPAYRGPAPINWALMNDDKETGVTIFKMDQGLDTGDIVLQKKIAIDNSDNANTLHEKLATEGARVLIEAIRMFEKSSCIFKPQDENLSSFAPKLKKEDGKIKWDSEATRIRNLVRATLGWPSAYTYYKNKMIKIIDSEVIFIPCEHKPSTIVNIDKEGICVATGKNLLKIKRLKPEGKKEMDAYSFVIGHKLSV